MLEAHDLPDIYTVVVKETRKPKAHTQTLHWGGVEVCSIVRTPEYVMAKGPLWRTLRIALTGTESDEWAVAHVEEDVADQALKFYGLLKADQEYGVLLFLEASKLQEAISGLTGAVSDNVQVSLTDRGKSIGVRAESERAVVEEIVMPDKSVHLVQVGLKKALLRDNAVEYFASLYELAKASV